MLFTSKLDQLICNFAKRVGVVCLNSFSSEDLHHLLNRLCQILRSKVWIRIPTDGSFSLYECCEFVLTGTLGRACCWKRPATAVLDEFVCPL